MQMHKTKVYLAKSKDRIFETVGEMMQQYNKNYR